MLSTSLRQALMIDMVGEKQDLGNAIALNSSMVNGARLLGPTIAGILISATGEGVCFLINALSYIFVIVSLFMMNLKPHERTVRTKNIFHELHEGFSYSFGFTPIASIILLLALVSLVGMPYTVLMPVFAKNILHGGSHTFGFLMGGVGIGALAGALGLASRKSVLGLGKIIPASAAVFGAGLIVFSFSRSIPLSICLMPIVGFGMMLQMASSNTILQTIVDDNKRGRVMSLYTMAFMGTVPFGSLLAGSLASAIGAPNTIRIGGVLCIAGALIFTRKLDEMRKLVHPIYVKLGIIPEVAEGIQSATELAVPPEQ